MSRDSVILANEKRLAAELRLRLDGSQSYPELFQHVIPSALGVVPLVLSKYVGASSQDLAVDGSGVPVTFDLAPSSAATWRIDRLTIVLAAAGAIVPTAFGDLPALANGLTLEVRSATAQVVDLLGGKPLKSLNDLAALARLEVVELGAGHTVRAVIDLPVPVRLEGADGELLRATVSDNLTGLTRLRIHALGQSEGTLT